MQSHKDRMISVHLEGKPFHIQVYAPNTNAEEAAVEQFSEDLQDLLEATPQNRCHFHHRGLECRTRKSTDTWNNGQVWPWSTKQAEQRLTEFCQGNAVVTANTLFQQHKR